MISVMAVMGASPGFYRMENTLVMSRERGIQ
jgi:hypothetical protein